MHAHLRGKHPLNLSGESQATSGTAVKASDTQKRQSNIFEFSNRPIHERRKQEITEKLIAFVVKDVRPISAIHGQGFQDLIHFFEPGYTIPSRTSLWKQIQCEYDNVKSQLAAELKTQSVSLTTDLWTSVTMDAYITVTAHYITESWQLKSKILQTAIMSERHTAVNISERMNNIVQEWGIDVFCTVHDNASSMNLAMEICDQFPNDLGCSGHTLQLAITAGLSLPDISKAVEAARRVVGHFRCSALATSELKKQQVQLDYKQNKLLNDCATRWSSTLFMLERLFEQRLAVQTVLTDETVTKEAACESLLL
ncbi:zinc finger BED domain-containing protein DAYSLEEPER-like [Acipenser oxyrinchus oxyrinchus]|uniref:Zinc finger BED domain-containing protein DAYSLEEPER-like n=1 Tax=Acipenser oxyrinchus oxyrinchus TaxID=40147 RepID=A0AAD8LNE6_ACIOX|nr:zinc finger BED domain-containing protein DAYSLEEPER-like [Acipenser oxyrinchus oxyrinchus]